MISARTGILPSQRLDQISDRNINTAVNQLIDNSGNYKSYFANTFSSLAPRFHVYSDLIYLNGRFSTGRFVHDVVIGGAGYRFTTYSPIAAFPKTALCTSYGPGGVCQANISDPLVYLVPPTGVPSYAKTGPSHGHLWVQHHPPTGIQPCRYHHHVQTLAGAAGREPGLDLDR